MERQRFFKLLLVSSLILNLWSLFPIKNLSADVSALRAATQRTEMAVRTDMNNISRALNDAELEKRWMSPLDVDIGNDPSKIDLFWTLKEYPLNAEVTLYLKPHGAKAFVPYKAEKTEDGFFQVTFEHEKTFNPSVSISLSKVENGRLVVRENEPEEKEFTIAHYDYYLNLSCDNTVKTTEVSTFSFAEKADSLSKPLHVAIKAKSKGVSLSVHEEGDEDDKDYPFSLKGVSLAGFAKGNKVFSRTFDAQEGVFSKEVERIPSGIEEFFLQMDYGMGLVKEIPLLKELSEAAGGGL